jgi:DNA-binding NarL/FixJ family response regulator
MKKIKVIFIDTAQLFRKGFALYLNALNTIEVTQELSAIKDLNDCDLSSVDLILFDTFSDDDFFILAEIQKEHPELHTLLLSSEKRLFVNYLFSSTNKVNAFLSKEVEPEMVVETIENLVFENATDIIFPSDIRERLFGEGHIRDSFFTPKELNVLSLLGKGKSTTEAAQILNNSKRTVETHRRRMIERIGCKNIIPVIMYALDNNYIRIEPQEY